MNINKNLENQAGTLQMLALVFPMFLSLYVHLQNSKQQENLAGSGHILMFSMCYSFPTAMLLEHLHDLSQPTFPFFRVSCPLGC